MPIAVRVVSEQDYAAWLEQAKKKYATDDSRAGGESSVAAQVRRVDGHEVISGRQRQGRRN